MFHEEPPWLLSRKKGRIHVLIAFGDNPLFLICRKQPKRNNAGRTLQVFTGQ